MKKVIVLVLILSLFLSMMPASAIAAGLQETQAGSAFVGGIGTESNPYLNLFLRLCSGKILK